MPHTCSCRPTNFRSRYYLKNHELHYEKIFKAITDTDVNHVAVREDELGPCSPKEIAIRTRNTIVIRHGTARAYSNAYKVESPQFYHNDWPHLVIQANYIPTFNVNPFGLYPGEGVTILSPHDRGIEDRQRATEQFHRGTLRAKDFIQTIAPIEDAPAAYAALRDDKNQNFSLVFD